MNKDSDPTVNKFLYRVLFPFRSKTVLYCAEIFTDFSAIFISIIAGYAICNILFYPLPEGTLFYCRLGLVAGVTGVLTFHFNGLYRHQASMMNLLETRKIIRITLMAFLFLILYSFSVKAPYSRITLYLALALLLPTLLLGRFFFYKLNQYFYLHGVHVRNILICGTGATGRLLFQSISHTPKLGYQPIGFFDTDAKDIEAIGELLPEDIHRNILLATNFEHCLQIIKENNIQDIFLSKPLYEEHGEQLQQLLSLCQDQQIILHSVPYLQHLVTKQVIFNDINGIPLVSFREIPDGTVERFTKRCFDLIITGILTILFAPLIAIIAILIRIDSKGSCLFKQTRIGKNGVPFAMYKFRSMFIDTPDFQHSPTMGDDPRITRVGRLLRKTSLDELPQIFNILQGTMSLVGPRPEMEFIVKNEYNDLYRQRLRVKPGVTGIWQISADRTREIHEDISYDLFYIANRSFLLDILILLRTIPALFTMRTY